MATNVQFDWRNEDFSWLGDQGQGFGGNSPLEIYARDPDFFDWLPANLPPKAPGGGAVTVEAPTIFVPDIPEATGHTDVNIAGAKVAWRESFDSGAGMFSNHWGPGTDTSVPGQITVWTSADDQDSGMMTNPAGYGTPAGGWGYGLYSFTLKTTGTIGVYALLWPGTNNWPGPELDVLEVTPGGDGYFAHHWRGDSGNVGTGGSNDFTIFGWGNIDFGRVNTFSLLWEQGRLTGYLNGEERWTTTDRVPLDYAHGGENLAPGIGAQTSWNDGEMGGRNYITLYEASYSVIA